MAIIYSRSARGANGEKPEARELAGHLLKRARSYIIEKQVETLLGGGF